MIFTRLTLVNFGVFKGSHTLSLKPVANDKPIILIGGLNGAGKTTLLDALQLVLYGKFAQCSNRGRTSYEKFLAQTINHQAGVDEAASIVLEFLIPHQSGSSCIQVKREWYRQDSKTPESLTILVDGIENSLISANWSEYVDEFLPRSISSLFFFDGEKIEELANPKTAAKIIKTGLVSLLGLDLIDQLGVDLRTIDRRRQKKNIDTKAVESIVQLENEIAKLESELQQATQEKATIATLIDSINSQIRTVDEAFQRAGGDFYSFRENINTEHASAQKALVEIENEIRHFLADEAPLLLVQELIARARETTRREEKIISDRGTLELLKQRDADIVAQLSKKNGDSDMPRILRSLLNKDITKRSKSAAQTIFININPEMLEQYDKRFFANISDSHRKLKTRHEEARHVLSEWEQKRAMIPDESNIKSILNELEELESEKSKQEAVLIGKIALEQKAIQRFQGKSEQLDKLLENLNEEQIQDFQDKQLLRHSTQAQQTLMRYRAVLISKNIGYLEQKIKECFDSLSRKETLIEHIRIDPDNYSLRLIRKTGPELLAKRLSAGERQLLAISVLWGLAKASGQSIPTVIDTPLGRLDSQHRRTLIQRYFPNASDQVIMLSTDTEVDALHLDELRPHVSHDYHIEYVDKLNGSVISEGYF